MKKFKIIPKKKKELTKLASKKKKSVVITQRIEKFFFVMSICGTLLFLIYSLSGNTRFMEEVMGVVKKQYFMIALYATIIFLLNIFFGVMIHFLKLNLMSSNTEERIDEELTIDQNSLFYSFRIKYQSRANERIAIEMPFGKIEEVHYDSECKKLEIVGQISREYINIKDENNLSNKKDFNQSKIIIYDYFNPSLYLTMKEMNIKMMTTL